MALVVAEVKRRIRFLHGLAEEVRTVAKAMHDLKSRRTMLMMAAAYERMAEHLELEHLSLPTKPSPRLSP
jgi:hypothetical protein